MAAETADNPQRVFRLSQEERQAVRQLCDRDPWSFNFYCARQLRGGVERFHKVLLYLFSGSRCAHLLAHAIDQPECQSELTRQIKAELVRRGIDWRTRKGLRSLARLLRKVNARISRSMGKSIFADIADAWIGSINPNESIGIASKSDPAAEKHLAVIAGIIRSAEYQFFYPDRLRPKNPEGLINKNWITLWGRTDPDETTFFGQGINSPWTGHHFSRVRTDDIIGSESGDADESDALRFLANIGGISRPEGLGGTEHLAPGTVYSPTDDYAALAANPDYLTVRIPVWLKKVSTIETIKVDGEPVLPEWYPLERIRAERAAHLANDSGGHGPIAWLQNFELTAHQAGTVHFTRQMLENAAFEWVKGADPRRPLIRRARWMRDENGNRVPILRFDPALGRNAHHVVQFDPLLMPRTIGIDQATSEELHADEWAISCSCIDPYGVKYQLQTAYGKGYWQMIAMLPIVWDRWTLNGQYPIFKIGVEADAQQETTSDWLQRDDDFRRFARYIVKVRSRGVSKPLRIQRHLVVPLQMDELALDPNDLAMKSEMLNYRPGPNAKDGKLDSLSISVSLHQRRGDEEVSEVEDYQRAAADEWKRDFDPSTGIYIRSNFLEAM